MKLGIKIATLLFFISGLVFFVGYQSGYFFPNDTDTDFQQEQPNIESRIEAPFVEDTLNRKDTAPAKKELNPKKEQVTEVEEKREEVIKISPKQMRAFSSKSAPIRLREMPEYKKFRMSSSKSLQPSRPFRELIGPRSLRREDPLKNRINIEPVPPNGPQNPNMDRELRIDKDTLK